MTVRVIIGVHLKTLLRGILLHEWAKRRQVNEIKVIVKRKV